MLKICQLNLEAEAYSQVWCFYLDYDYLDAKSISWIIAYFQIHLTQVSEVEKLQYA